MAVSVAQWITCDIVDSSHSRRAVTFTFGLIIIIIIMSCHRNGYPLPSLATSPYRSSPLAGLQGYILYPDIAAVCMFELVVLLLPGHMWGFIGVYHLWARPCFSSSDLHVYYLLSYGINITTTVLPQGWLWLSNNQRILVFFCFKGISTFVGYLMTKLLL